MPLVEKSLALYGILDRHWAHLYERDGNDTGALALVFDGGAYRTCSPDQVEEVCRFLARRGVNALAVRYYADEVQNIEWSLQDAQLAYDWAFQYATRNGQPPRLGLLGFSAGGNLALALALSLDATDLSPLSLIVSISGPTTRTIPVPHSPTVPFHEIAEHPGLGALAGKDVIIWNSKNEAIPKEHAIYLDERLDLSGAFSTLKLIGGKQHALALWDEADVPTRRAFRRAMSITTP